MGNKETTLSIILRAVDRATSQIKTFTDKIDKIGKKVGAVGSSMSTTFTLPVAAGFAYATRSLVNFEQGMSNVSTLIDTNTENIDAMGGKILEIGRRTPVALEDLTSTLYDIRSAGISAADQFLVLERSAQLGVAGLGSTKEAANLVTSALNAFQLQGSDAAGVYDTIFKTVKAGKTNIAELSRGFGSVAGTVAASNIKLDEYLASVAALTTTGLPAAEAHTQLRAVIAGLTRTTKQTSAVFHRLGAKDFKDLVEKSGGLVPALTRINAVLKGNSSRMLELFGSTEALNAAIGLTGAQGGVFASTLKDMRDGADAVGIAFDKQNETMASGLTRTKNALQAVGISIGTILAPTLEKLSGWLQRAVDWFDKLNPATKEWIVRIAAVVAAVGPALLVISKLTQGISAVVTVVRVLGAALLGNPIGLALTAIAIAAALIIKYWEPISAFFKDLWAGITAEFEAAYADIKAIVDAIIGAVDTITNALGSIAGGHSYEELTERLRRRQEGPPLDVGAVAESHRRDRAAAQAHVKIDFANAPKGTRVAADPRSTADVDFSVGYQMVMP